MLGFWKLSSRTDIILSKNVALLKIGGDNCVGGDTMSQKGGLWSLVATCFASQLKVGIVFKILFRLCAFHVKIKTEISVLNLT